MFLLITQQTPTPHMSYNTIIMLTCVLLTCISEKYGYQRERACVCVSSNHIGPSLPDNSISVRRYRSTLMDLHHLITTATGQYTSAV